MPKNAKIFYCEICDFKCSKQSNYNKHLLTRKHKILTDPNKKMPHDNMVVYSCICGKKYKHISSLCAHKKICDLCNDFESSESNESNESNESSESNEINESSESIIVSNNKDTNELKDVIMVMMNENKELRNMLMEQQKQLKDQQHHIITQQSTHNNQITEIIPKIGNNTNNTFNINMYLNNECKDAMNITDFTRAIEISMDDFKKVGSHGYVNGISQIIVNAIKDMEVTKRPLHCSDAKREILYVKDNNAWEKDNNKEILNKAISSVGRKTLQHFPEWMENNPECNSTNTPKNEEYHNIIDSTISQNTNENKKKIAKNIIKEVIIDK